MTDQVRRTDNKAAKKLRELHRDALVGWDSKVLTAMDKALNDALEEERGLAVELCREKLLTHHLMTCYQGEPEGEMHDHSDNCCPGCPCPLFEELR